MPESKTVLVTGASSGLGQATAALLASKGYRVFGTSRKPPSTFKPNGFEMLQLDVDSDESVNACIQALRQKTERMDILVNNAGFSVHGSIEETSVNEAKAAFETNFFGVVRLVRAVLPIMRQQGGGQIINVSSISGLVSSPFIAYYCASKFALEGYTEALRYEVKRFNIKVSLLEPGYFRSNIGNSSLRAAASGSIHDYSEMYQRWFSTIGESTQSGDNPERIALTVLQIVETKSPRLRYLVGSGSGLPRIRGIVPEFISEAVTRKQWKLDA